MSMVNLTEDLSLKCKVSSQLNKSAEYAAKNMFNCDASTCWNSGSGNTQFILIDFQKEVIPKKLQFIFQGGFVGLQGFVQCGNSLDSLYEIGKIQSIVDSNDLQEIQINNSEMDGRYLKIVFDTFSDFYGRLVIYRCIVYGFKQVI